MYKTCPITKKRIAHSFDDVCVRCKKVWRRMGLPEDPNTEPRTGRASRSFVMEKGNDKVTATWSTLNGGVNLTCKVADPRGFEKKFDEVTREADPDLVSPTSSIKREPEERTDAPSPTVRPKQEREIQAPDQYVDNLSNEVAAVHLDPKNFNVVCTDEAELKLLLCHALDDPEARFSCPTEIIKTKIPSLEARRWTITSHGVSRVGNWLSHYHTVVFFKDMIVKKKTLKGTVIDIIANNYEKYPNSSCKPK